MKGIGFTLTFSWNFLISFGLSLELVVEWLGETIITIENTEIMPMTDVANEAAKNPNIAKLFAKIPTMKVAIIIKPPQIVKT